MKIIDGQISKNFNLSEFKCRHCSDIIVNEKTLKHIKRLQLFRAWYGRPMVIASGYRCKTHNLAVKGADNSYHMQGVATDFSLPNEFYSFNSKRKEEFISNIINQWEKIGGGGVGIYDTFIHLDSRNGKYYVFDSRKIKNYIVSQ